MDDTKRVVTITRYLDTDLRFAEDGGLKLQVQQKKGRDAQTPGKAEFLCPNRSKLPEIHVEASMSLTKGLSAPSERGKVLPWRDGPGQSSSLEGSSKAGLEGGGVQRTPATLSHSPGSEKCQENRQLCVACRRDSLMSASARVGLVS